MKKRILALLLCLVLAVSLLPATAWAADSATVYVSVAKDGSFVEGKDDSVIARVPISLSGENPTIDAAFRQLHISLCAEGESAYASTEEGFITKFWGVETANIGYYKNNEYVKTSTTEQVSNNDELVFWFYQDTVKYSDQYTYFDEQTASVSGGEPLTLTLRTTEGAMAGADITVDGTPLPGKQSGKDGTVTLYFAESGEHLVSANAPEGSYIVPPVCLVTVNGDDANAAAGVNEDKEALSIPETANDNLTLPLVGSSGKTSIAWSTSDAAVLTADGKVTRGEAEKNVTLTATLTYGKHTAERAFTVTVPALGDKDLVALAAEALEAGLTPNQYNDDFTAAGDTNIITLAQQVVDKAVSGVTVAGTVTSDNSAIAANGDITYPKMNSTGNVTFTLQKGSAEKTVTCAVTVPESAMTRQEYMDEALAAYPDALLSNGKNTDLQSIKENLAKMGNPSTVNYYVQITWTIPDEGKDYLSVYGDVTRPAYGQPDVSFTLKGTATWYGMMEQWGMPSGCVGPTPDAKEIEIQLTILAITKEEDDAAKEEVDAALAAVDIKSADFVSDFNDSTAPVNPASVTSSALNLKSAAAYSTGITTVWTSSDEALIKSPAYKTGKAEVTRPAPGEAAKSCTLTLTLSKNGYEAHKDFTFTVEPLSQDEINAEKAYLEKVKEALTFDVIRQDNTGASEVTGNLNMAYRGIVDKESGEVTWKYSNSGSEGAKIEWATSNADVILTNGTVTRQAADTQVTMTATISSQVLPAAQVPPVTVEIPVTVLGVDSLSKAQRIDTLLDNIAASYVNESSEWKVMDMGAYALYKPDASAKLSETARQTYINKAIASINKTAAVGDTVYSKAILALTASGVDVTKLYPENSNTPINAITGLNGTEQKSSPWNAPYTLMSYNQADYAGTEQYEQALVQKVLAEQKEDGSWDSYGTIDTTANVLAGLAFYAGDPDVADAIEKGIEYLSGQMGANGTYDDGRNGSNANSTAMVIIGLCANGVNPETDPRFVKNGVSVLDGLLSFALADNSGFGYTDNSKIDSGSTEQGFRALIAAAQTLNSGKALNVYDFSKVTVSAAHATGTGAVTPPEASTGDNITVTVSVKADTGYWLSGKSVTVPGTGAKVYHAFVKALEGSGITQVGAENNYVSSMTCGEKTLAEFTKGSNSGWLYKVNGELPTVGLTKFAISDGDEIVFFYTEDYTREEGGGSWSSGGTAAKPEDKAETTLNPEIEANANGEANAVISEDALNSTIADAKTDKAGVIVIAPEVKGEAGKVSVELPKSGVDSIAKQTSADLKVETGIADITIPQKSLEDLAKQSGSKVTVSAETVKDTDKVKLEVAVDGRSVEKLSGGVAVSVPARDEKSGNVLVIVNSDGSENIVRKSIVDGKTVEAVLDGSCTVKVVDNSKAFADTASHWGRDAAAFASSHELFNGTGANTFSPDAAMSRAMLATVLYRLEDAAASGSSAFADVPEGTWYTDAVTWASGAGIVTGTGSGFDPNGNVTREQLATMLYRYAKTLGMSTGASGGLSGFSDGGKTSGWARDAMEWAVGSGLISGKGSGILDPTGSATRAEVAVIMQRLIGLMVK